MPFIVLGVLIFLFILFSDVKIRFLIKISFKFVLLKLIFIILFLLKFLLLLLNSSSSGITSKSFFFFSFINEINSKSSLYSFCKSE